MAFNLAQEVGIRTLERVFDQMWDGTLIDLLDKNTMLVSFDFVRESLGRMSLDGRMLDGVDEAEVMRRLQKSNPSKAAIIAGHPRGLAWVGDNIRAVKDFLHTQHQGAASAAPR